MVYTCVDLHAKRFLNLLISVKTFFYRLWLSYLSSEAFRYPTPTFPSPRMYKAISLVSLYNWKKSSNDGKQTAIGSLKNDDVIQLNSPRDEQNISLES